MTESEQFCQDLDLIKLAAKAAGMHWETESYGSLLMTWGKDQPSGKPFAANGCYSGWSWNPLIDDGDAFRLAVALTMMIDYIKKPATAYMHGHVVAVSSAGSFYEAGFTQVATRRAIVRAAAEIGKAMK